MQKDEYTWKRMINLAEKEIKGDLQVPSVDSPTINKAQAQLDNRLKALDKALGPKLLEEVPVLARKPTKHWPGCCRKEGQSRYVWRELHILLLTCTFLVEGLAKVTQTVTAPVLALTLVAKFLTA